MVLNPVDKIQDLRMSGAVLPESIWIFTRSGVKKSEEGLRGWSRENRCIDHGAAPLLTVGRDDANAKTAHLCHRIGRMRIWAGYVEAPYHWISATHENLCLRKLLSLAIRLKCPSKANALGMVPAMTKCWSSWWFQRSHHLLRC